MARSGNQGLQIALIIFVMLTIVLSLTTFIFFKQAEDAKTQAKTDSEAARQATASLTTAVTELKEVERIIGHSTDAGSVPLTTVQETYSKDMEAYAAAFGENKLNYREALEALIVSLRTANEQIRTERDELNALKVRLDTMEQEKTATLTEQRQQATTAAEQLAQQQDAWAKRDTAQRTQITSLEADVKAQKELVIQEQAGHEKQVKALQIEIAQLTQLNAQLTGEVQEIKQVTFETSDGEIRWVNQRQRIVWINLGRADSLPKQMPFSVWGRDENDVARAQHKAKIEVTQILGDHLAEARIVEDDIGDPILPGDKIYTPLWQVGRQEHFAVAGFIDFNKDGQSDLNMLRQLVERNGGAIDAILGDDGKITGPGMTIETRYLVMGAPGEFLDKYSDMQTQAQRLGVEEVTLSKFLDHMGWKDPSNLVELGLNADPDDFQGVGRQGGANPLAPGSGQFRRRNPREAGRSAFEGGEGDEVGEVDEGETEP